MATTPIRVGFIGLNANESWAVRAHLPYLQHSPDYQIVALLNSSEDSAKASIASHGLPSETKAYGSAEEFAKDGDIDLIVCSVRVDKHHPVLMPILENTAAKAVHCEWPLGKNLAEAEELAALAKKKGMRSIVGLQGRAVPTVEVVKKLVESGRIGSILSVNVIGAGYNFGAEDLHTLSYLSDINFGGNMVTIHVSHVLDTITTAIGQLDTYSVILETKRPKTLLRNKPHTYKPTSPDDEPVKIIGEVPRTSYDQVMLQGHFTNGALFTFHVRGGMPFPDTPGIEWRIYGETGEIKITTPSMNLHYGGPGHVIQVHDHKTNAVEDVGLPLSEFDKIDPPWPSRGPARVYEAFAAGKEDVYATWEDAVKRHRLVEEMYARVKAGGDEKPAKYTSE